MRKIIAAFNLTLDGFCDHTAFDPDEEVHDHYTQLLRNSSMILYGNSTFQLMKFWKELLLHPSGEKSMDEFALAMDRIPKIIFSNQFKTNADLGWETADLASKSLEETVRELKNHQSGDVLVGSRSLIVQLTNLELIDEFQLCIHPVIVGKGLSFFYQIPEKHDLQLKHTKIFGSGAVLLTYSSA
ncbi:dihydrofolate reductase family protein [Algoriphagus aestuarii]|nr:dihydrofolate reductase family protein [Algoriphagus aestuarii]